MTLQNTFREHLAASGQSMQALSLQAGLNPKAVSDIFNRPGRLPTRRTLESLSEAMGTELPDPGPRTTYAALIATLSKKTGDESVDSRNATRVSRLKKVIRAAGWVSEIEEVDRRRMLDRFAGWSPASLGLSKGSFGTYKCDVLAAIEAGCGANRKQGMHDVSGFYREIYDAVKKSNLPTDLKLSSGSFFFYLDRNGLLPAEITSSVLDDYYRHRLATSPKTEETCRKHVKRIAALCTRLASEPVLSAFKFPALDHPFEDGRDKYSVPQSMFAGFLEEFDGPVTRWVMGKESRDGLSYKDFLAQLDTNKPAPLVTDKFARLQPKKSGRKETDEERRSAGFLNEDETWSSDTMANRRGILLAGAKALYAATGFGIESVTEYTDPRVIEGVLEALQAGNSDGEFSSSYPRTLGKALKKLARDYVGRSEEEIEKIASMIKDYAGGKKGIAERNKAKLREIVGDRQQRLIDLGEILIDEVNSELDRRARKRRGVPRVDLIDADLARDVMCAVASDILLARAPRKENLIGALLSWIASQGDLARITVPNVEAKLRSEGDPHLPIPLGENESRRFRLYLEKVRPKALREGDDTNPFLFPARCRANWFSTTWKSSLAGAPDA